MSALPCRYFQCGPGGLVGDLDFLLERPRSFSARCEERTKLLVVSRGALARMAKDCPWVRSHLQLLDLFNCMRVCEAAGELWCCECGPV